MKMESQDNEDEEIVLRANYVFRRLNSPVTCNNVDEIEVSYFVSLYQILTDEDIPGSKNMTSERTKQTICQFMINSISDDILHLPLDHITGKGVVDKDRRVLKDLLDIFIELIEAADFNPENDKNISTVTDSGIIPPKIRKALKDIEVSAEQMIGSITQLQHFTSSQNVQTRSIQTTPLQLTSSSTSPVTWEKVLYDYQDKESKKHKQQGHRQPLRRALGSLSNYSPRHVTKAGKPKPVISTKFKRASPVVLQRQKVTTRVRPVKANITDKENMKKAMSLADELEKVRERRKEITQQINQLQNEDQRLQTLQSIMDKELKMSQFTKSKEPKKLQKSMTRHNPSSDITRLVSFR